MTVLEMQTRTLPAVRWTEVCATEHETVDTTADPAVRLLSSVPSRPAAPARRLRMPADPAEHVRSCRIAGLSEWEVEVVDDVPTWILLACGVVFGILLLLAAVLLGAPTYS